MTLFSWIGGGLLSLGKLIVLPFAKLNTPRVRPIVRWTLHVLFVAVIVGCLYWLGNYWRLQEVVRAPWPIVRMAWLPLLFGCVYALAWVAWWLWKVATSPDESPDFPDIYEAWQDGLHALAAAKIDLMQTPVYLLIGGEGNTVTGITQATGWTWDTPLTPRRPSSPMRICATRDAVFIDLSNACTSGLYASRLSARPQLQSVKAYASSLDADPIAGGVATAVASRRTVQRGLELIEQSLTLLETEHASTETHSQTHLDGIRLDEEELAIAEHRLTYVCSLLREARTPYCAANGIVALVPWEATATQATANRCAVLFDRDLQTINRELQIAAPRLALVTDMEAATGGADLIARMPADQRQRRFGVRFPRLAACDLKDLPRCVEESVSWLVSALFPALIYRVLKMTNSSDDSAGDWSGNTRIFGLANLVRQRKDRLLRVLQRGLVPSLEGAPLCGLYFSANSSDDQREQAFVSGVLPQLLEMQNDVAWSPKAIDDDRRARRWTMLGYAALALIVAGLAVVAFAA